MGGSWSRICALRRETDKSCTSSFDHEAGSHDVAVGNVVVYVRCRKVLLGLIRIYVSDDVEISQLRDDEVALHIGIGVGGVRDLEGKLRERKAGVPGAGADPIDAFVVRRAMGFEPQVGGSDCGLGAFQV